MEQLKGRLHKFDSQTVHPKNEENEMVHVLARSSLKRHKDTKRLLNYTKDKFRRLQSNLDDLQQILERLQQVEACDHRKVNGFMFAI